MAIEAGGRLFEPTACLHAWLEHGRGVTVLEEADLAGVGVGRQQLVLRLLHERHVQVVRSRAQIFHLLAREDVDRDNVGLRSGPALSRGPCCLFLFQGISHNRNYDNNRGPPAQRGEARRLRMENHMLPLGLQPTGALRLHHKPICSGDTMWPGTPLSFGATMDPGGDTMDSDDLVGSGNAIGSGGPPWPSAAALGAPSVRV